MSRPVPKLSWFNDALREIEVSVGLPQPVPFRGRKAFRYTDRSLQEAVTLKLARYISGLNAGHLLLSSGFFQELATLQRTLDEIHEDIYFLCLPQFVGWKTEFHTRYLQSFWEEEPEFKDFTRKPRNRDQILRKRIRSYLAKCESDGGTDHSAIATSAYLSRLYSGYVHAAAPQLLELYDPEAESFRPNGYADSPLAPDHASDFENQYFRGVFSVFVVARVVKNESVARTAFELHAKLENFFHD